MEDAVTPQPCRHHRHQLTETHHNTRVMLHSTVEITYQYLAYSDVINIEIARLWEDGHCNAKPTKT